MPSGLTWKMLASVLYRTRDSSSKRSSPRMRPLRSSRMCSRCAGSTSGTLKKTSTWRLLVLCQFLAADLFLAVALGDAQLKRLVLAARPQAPIVRVAAVTDHHVAHPQIQQRVENRGADQEGPGQPELVIGEADQRRQA